MTRDEFIQAYCARSGVTREDILQRCIALPCACGDEICEGWAMIPNNKFSIDWHMDCFARDSMPDD